MLNFKKRVIGGLPVLEIQMLGTGSAFSKKYDNNNALVYCNDFTLMLDCGITAPAALYRLGKTFADIDAVLITHIHADHVGGLEEFAFQMKFVYNMRPRLYVADAIADTLWENTLKGGLSQEEWQSLGDFFEVIKVQPGLAVTIHPGLKVEMLQTQHIPGKSSYSLLFNDTFFYTADMKFDAELLMHMVHDRGCTSIFHDCQLSDPGVVHASLSELLQLPDEMQERIHLMHYADNREEYTGKTGKMQFVEASRKYSI
jgi:phosphoribosyl 1,2-cyclic phosphodiesterase